MNGDEKQNRIKELENQNKDFSNQYDTLKKQFDSIEETPQKLTLGMQISIQLESIKAAIESNEEEITYLKSND